MSTDVTKISQSKTNLTLDINRDATSKGFIVSISTCSILSYQNTIDKKITLKQKIAKLSA